MTTLTIEAPGERATRESLIELEAVVKIYRTGKLEYPALHDVDQQSVVGFFDAALPGKE